MKTLSLMICAISLAWLAFGKPTIMALNPMSVSPAKASIETYRRDFDPQIIDASPLPPLTSSLPAWEQGPIEPEAPAAPGRPSYKVLKSNQPAGPDGLPNLFFFTKEQAQKLGLKKYTSGPCKNYYQGEEWWCRPSAEDRIEENPTEPQPETRKAQRKSMASLGASLGN